MPADHDPAERRAHRGRILVVDDDRRMASQTAQWLCRGGFHASAVATVTEAVRAVGRERFDCCLLDAGLIRTASAAQAVRNIRQASPAAGLVLLRPAGCRMDQLPHGPAAPADVVLDWPAADVDLLEAIASAIQAAFAVRDNLPGVVGLPGVIGRHDAMRQVYEIIDKVACTPATVLLTGETGTGKSHLARVIHERSGLAGRFVEVSCGAVAEGLLESELFGHVAGAFTGAVRDREGRFREAKGGTLFLDEIATASPAMQVRLLRSLQERRVEPVGGSRSCEVDARVILATHENLERLVAEGRFREDLFWRINVITIEMPPLRERVEDVPLLAAHFLTAAATMAGRRVEGFSQEAVQALANHPWPGNVRELRHAVERAVLLGGGRLVELADLPDSITAGGSKGGSLRADLEQPERQLILEALRRHNWSRQAAARALGINRTTLYKKFKRLGIDASLLGTSVR